MQYWSFNNRLGWVVRDRIKSASACPRCRNALYRIPARLIDRLLSFRKQRFRCEFDPCGWEGNLAIERPIAPK